MNQCEVFRREIQSLRDSSVKNTTAIDLIEKDVEVMQKELHKMHKALTAKQDVKQMGFIQLIANPLIILGAVIFFLILLISDLKVEKTDSLLKGVLEKIP